MYFTTHNEVARGREMTTVFGGYNHRLSCVDGEFYDMQNMTTAYYPMLSPRNKRGHCRKFTNPQALIDKDGLCWVDNGEFYLNGEATTWSAFSPNAEGPIPLVKMGTKIIAEGNSAYDTEKKEWESLIYLSVYGHMPTIVPASDTGEPIEWKWSTDYDEDTTPEDGAYAMFEEDGKYIMKQWKEKYGYWSAFTSKYVFFSLYSGSEETDPLWEVGQTIKISVNNSKNEFDAIIGMFPDNEGDGKYSVTTDVVKLVPTSYDSTSYEGFIVEGKISQCTIYGTAQAYPTIEIDPMYLRPKFLTECNNRLWGCSEEGHEIYATMLGKWKRWKCFNGVSTDSYAVTIGSDGKFTGSVTYNGNPIFFKENSMIKVTVSSTGAHQVREIACPGVQGGSNNSICIINGILYYKGVEGIYAYDGSFPVLVSSSLGEVRYYEAVADTILDRYYVSMKDNAGKSHMFVYDTNTKMWAKEDNTDAMLFCRSGDDLYYIDNADNKLKSVRGTLYFEGEGETEGKIDWYAESGNIGFSLPDKKYLAKLVIRLSMDLGTNVGIYLQYDSSGTWEHICNLHGTGTRSFNVPVLPRRCDHFKYMIAGRGGCKIFSVTKTIEEGSDV